MVEPLRPRQLTLDVAPALPPTFDNFVVGHNGPLLAALHDAVVGQHHVYLWGEPSSGRSHLLQATAHAARQSGRPACDLPATVFHAGIQPPALALLAVDDIHTLGDDAQDALFHLFNRARSEGLTLVLAGNVAPRQLVLHEDLRTRVGQSVCLEIRSPDDDARRALLAALAARRGITLSDDAIAYLLQRARRDTANLVALVASIDEHSLSARRAVTLPLLREALAQPAPPFPD